MLELMSITGYTDEEFQNKFSGNPYTFMINPDTIKIQKSIEYNEQQAPATSSASQKYKSTPSDKLNFEITYYSYTQTLSSELVESLELQIKKLLGFETEFS